MPSTGFQRFFTLFLLAVYLLSGGGPARALVWCNDTGGHSHVEINQTGNCQTPCDYHEALPVSSPERRGLQGETGEPSCQDILLSSSQVKDSRLSRLVPSQTTEGIQPSPPLYTFADSLRLAPKPAVTEQSPPLMLAVLRTVILLN